jgi:hypothetical protein
MRAEAQRQGSSSTTVGAAARAPPAAGKKSHARERWRHLGGGTAGEEIW